MKEIKKMEGVRLQPSLKQKLIEMGQAVDPPVKWSTVARDMIIIGIQSIYPDYKDPDTLDE